MILKLCLEALLTVVFQLVLDLGTRICGDVALHNVDVTPYRTLGFVELTLLLYHIVTDLPFSVPLKSSFCVQMSVT